VLPDRSDTSRRNDRPQSIRPLGVATTSSPSCSTEETEGEMPMIKEVRCLPHTEVRQLASGMRPAQGGTIGYGSGRLRVADREHQPCRCLHPPGIDLLQISQVPCRGQHDEAKRRAGPTAGSSFGNRYSHRVGR
jgi:hypothetical protein